MSLFPLILPDFLLIAIGCLLLRANILSRDFFNGAERLVYYILFPALLFHSLAQAPLDLSSSITLITAAACLTLSGIALSWLMVPLFRPDPLVHASIAQCAYRYNTYIGLSLSGSIAGAEGQGLMAIIVGITVPMVNFAAVHALSRHQGSNLLRESLRNPLILATFAGLLFNMSGLDLPTPVATALSRLGACAIAVGLLCVGASLTLSFEPRKGTLGIGISTILIRLMIMPLCALAIAQVLHLPIAERQMLLLFGALPTASAAYVLATRMGGDGRLVALVMTSTTMLSAITLPFWLSIGSP
ncbi:AEC family transporter [Paracandidimonas soli]|uniref:AEC family transporter n=1 Tax=Paracandidimonas soli TaxID=1917182 RepID=UPI003341CA94